MTGRRTAREEQTPQTTKTMEERKEGATGNTIKWKRSRKIRLLKIDFRMGGAWDEDGEDEGDGSGGENRKGKGGKWKKEDKKKTGGKKKGKGGDDE